MRVGTILVPCDFSAHAEYAFTWALELAERWQAKIVLFARQCSRTRSTACTLPSPCYSASAATGGVNGSVAID